MCGIGKYGLTIGSKNGTADCISCNEGTFSDITGVQSVNDCKECPAGYQNQQTGSPACMPCQAGKFRKLKKLRQLQFPKELFLCRCMLFY